MVGETRKIKSSPDVKTNSLQKDYNRHQLPTYPNVKHGADRLVVTGFQGHVALVTQLNDVLPFPEDPVTPGRSTTLLTEMQSPCWGNSATTAGPTAWLVLWLRQGTKRHRLCVHAA